MRLRNKTCILLYKSLVVLLGMSMIGIGINLVLIANIGTDAVTAAVIGIYNLTKVASFGSAQIIFGIVFVGAGFLLNRNKVGIGTVIATFASGFFIDLFKPFIHQVIPSDISFPTNIVILVAGLIISGIAIAIYLSADFGVGAGEILAVIISEKKKWQFRYVKMVSDALMLLFGFLCGAVVGIGTVISVLLIGPIIQFALPYAIRTFGIKQ